VDEQFDRDIAIGSDFILQDRHAALEVQDFCFHVHVRLGRSLETLVYQRIHAGKSTIHHAIKVADCGIAARPVAKIQHKKGRTVTTGQPH
jgi:hypothetical protein